MSTSLLYHPFGLIGYFYQSTSYIAGVVIVAIRDDYWRLRCPVCRSRNLKGVVSERGRVYFLIIFLTFQISQK